jgi:hypothetical protein
MSPPVPISLFPALSEVPTVLPPACSTLDGNIIVAFESGQTASLAGAVTSPSYEAADNASRSILSSLLLSALRKQVQEASSAVVPLSMGQTCVPSTLMLIAKVHKQGTYLIRRDAISRSRRTLRATRVARTKSPAHAAYAVDDFLVSADIVSEDDRRFVSLSRTQSYGRNLLSATR